MSETDSTVDSERLTEPIVLCQDGDLTFVVGEYKQRMLVNKSHLRNASSVWRSMFSSQWAEHGTSEMPLDDDDADALLIVVAIAHHRYNFVPKELDWEELVDLAIICDQYDTVHLVRYFLDLHGWASKFEDRVLEPGYEAWLFVAWVFGYPKIFEKLAQHLLFNLETDQDDNLLNRGEELGAVWPPESIDRIAELRRDTIEQIRQVCKEIIANFKCQHESELPASARIQKSVEQCHNISLYPLREKCRNLKLSLGDEDSAVCTKNIRTLADAFRVPNRSLDMFLTAGRLALLGSVELMSDGKLHESCRQSADVSDVVTVLINTVPSPILESHRTHMEIQASKGQ